MFWLIFLGAPVVSFNNSKSAYDVDKEYELKCDIMGYPSLVVWWQWKPLRDDTNWRDVEYNGKSLNREKVTTKLTDWTSVETRLRVTAKQSGFYICNTFNSIGNNSAVLQFFVRGMHSSFSVFIWKLFFLIFYTENR